MSRFVRASSYRHLYGQPAKKEQSYDNIKVSASAWDTNLVSANPKYIAVNYQSGGGGAFLVAPLSRPGKLPDIYPLVRGHAAPVLDTAWSPFHDELIASAGEDGKVALTKIDNDNVFSDAWSAAESDKKSGGQNAPTVADIEPFTKLQGHGRKAGHVVWHPSADNVLVSASNDIKLWDVSVGGAAVQTLQSHPDMVQSLSFNPTGALLATTCRDKKLRIFDVRAGAAPVAEGDSHSGVKGSRVCWLGAGAGGGNRIVTTGFSKMSDRQVFLWDSGNVAAGKRLKEISIDTSSGTLMPFWTDNNVLFLAGKGDGNIRYYEYENDELFYLTEHKSSDPQRGMCFLPRRALNTSDNEIARAFKVANNIVEPVSFIVPRKSDMFQTDLYPDAPSANPALSASDFFGGKTSMPILSNMESGKDSGPAALSAAPPFTRSPAPSAAPSRSATIPTPAPAASAPAPEPTPAPVSSPPPSSANGSKPFSLSQAKADEDWDAAPVSTPVASIRSPPPPSAAPVSAASSRSATLAGNGSSDSGEVSQLREENAHLKQEVGSQRKQIRELELEVESMRAKLEKISKAIL